MREAVIVSERSEGACAKRTNCFPSVDVFCTPSRRPPFSLASEELERSTVSHSFAAMCVFYTSCCSRPFHNAKPCGCTSLFEAFSLPMLRHNWNR